MDYKPKIIKGIVKGTGWPIDGHMLYFSQWDYDNYESWHLFGWDDADDEAIMKTMFITETEAGFCCYDTIKEFIKEWKAGKWEAQGSFCLNLDQVESLEVIQQEVKNDTRDQLRERGFDLTPRQYSDKGGFLCLPLDKNLSGDVRAKHPEWAPINCPNCGRKCWKMPEADKLKATQGVAFLCTECAVKAGFLKSDQQPSIGNRAQRRNKRKK